MSVCITGRELEPASLAAIARDGAPVAIDPPAREQIAAAASVVTRAAPADRPIYGVTTGLGPRVVGPVSGAQAAAFSLRTLRGRANGVGAPLPSELSRAAMAVRLNGLCAGGAGAGLNVAQGLAGLLNAGVHPIIPASGSIGAADLCLLAHMGLFLVGEGEAEYGGESLAGAEALRRAGLGPVGLGPKDGLALCSSSAVSVGTAALAWLDAEAALSAVQVSAALALEGFRANLSPLDPRVVAARPAPGQAWAASGLQALLAGGTLTQVGAARRLQDPLSFRCASQIHTALALLTAALGPQLEGAADNPLVLVADDEVLSTGNFHLPALAIALDATAIGVVQAASAITERSARLKTERLSGLPASLVTADATSSGAAPLGKTAQALTLEIRHPPPRWPSTPRSAPTGSRMTAPAPLRPRCACAISPASRAAGRDRAPGRMSGDRPGRARAPGERDRCGTPLHPRVGGAPGRGPPARARRAAPGRCGRTQRRAAGPRG